MMKASSRIILGPRSWNALLFNKESNYYSRAASTTATSTANICVTTTTTTTTSTRQHHNYQSQNSLLNNQQRNNNNNSTYYHHHKNDKRWNSTCPLPACNMDNDNNNNNNNNNDDDAHDDSQGPVGDLFGFPDVGWDETIVGKTGSIRRSFGPQSNAEAMITCGGEALAARASFDPDYRRAQEWIRSHPVGPAVLSPILISGLVGSLVEAAFPKSVPVNSSMQYLRPLIVGVEVRAKIEVVSVCKTGSDDTGKNDGTTTGNENTITTTTATTTTAASTTTANEQNDVRERKNGHQVNLRTEVFRMNDEAMIAEGSHSIWIPDYLHM